MKKAGFVVLVVCGVRCAGSFGVTAEEALEEAPKDRLGLASSNSGTQWPKGG